MERSGCKVSPTRLDRQHLNKLHVVAKSSLGKRRRHHELFGLLFLITQEMLIRAPFLSVCVCVCPSGCSTQSDSTGGTRRTRRSLLPNKNNILSFWNSQTPLVSIWHRWLRWQKKWQTACWRTSLNRRLFSGDSDEWGPTATSTFAAGRISDPRAPRREMMTAPLLKPRAVSVVAKPRRGSRVFAKTVQHCVFSKMWKSVCRRLCGQCND